MAVKVAPLSWNVPIVNSDGTPTNEFMRKWEAQKTVNAAVPTDAASMSTALDLVADTVGAILVREATAWGPVSPVEVGRVLIDGGVGSAPSWSAVSDVLDAALGGVRGSVVYRGASGWASLEPGTSGYVLQTNGVDADPTWEEQSGGGGGSSVVAKIGFDTYGNPVAAAASSGGSSTCIEMYSPPASSSFTLLANGGSASTFGLSDVDGLGMVFCGGVTTASLYLRAAMKAVPTGTPWSVSARLIPSIVDTRSRGFGMCVSDGTKTVTFGFSRSGTYHNFETFRFDTLTGVRSAYSTFFTVYDVPQYVRLSYSGSTFSVEMSADGRNWVTWQSAIDVSAYISTVSYVGLCVYPWRTDNPAAGVDDTFVAVPYWSETT